MGVAGAGTCTQKKETRQKSSESENGRAGFVGLQPEERERAGRLQYLKKTHRRSHYTSFNKEVAVKAGRVYKDVRG